MNKLIEFAKEEYTNYIKCHSLAKFHEIDHEFSIDDNYECLPLNENDFPNTSLHIHKIFGNVFKAYFAVIHGAKFLAPHRNKEKFDFYRCHIGIIVHEDDDGVLNVGKKQIKWKQNQYFVFDTTKTHSLYKSKHYTRVVLSIDFDKQKIPEELKCSFYV